MIGAQACLQFVQHADHEVEVRWKSAGGRSNLHLLSQSGCYRTRQRRTGGRNAGQPCRMILDRFSGSMGGKEQHPFQG